jgi:N-acetyl-anhydromuramyl-L-alanine amidase AmpD
MSSKTSLDISKIVQCRLKETQYLQNEYPKNQIYLHHTAGGGDAEAVSRFWGSNESKIATPFVIGESGKIVQCFSSKHWAWHLGVGEQIFKNYRLPFHDLNKTSIGIEVCNWGGLKYKEGNYYNYVGKKVKPEMVVDLEYKFKGHQFWYKYTDAQIESLRELLVYLCDTYDIPKTYRQEIWNVDREALKMTSGIYTHNSVRPDKSDMYPCPRVIEMLKNL